jgi:hypothetical protein
MSSPTCGHEVKYIEYVFHPSKLEFNLNFILKCNFYHTESTLHHHYKHQLVNAV